MKKIMIFACFICFAFAINAQYFLSVKEAFSYVKEYTAIPFSFDKNCKLRVSIREISCPTVSTKTSN